MTQVKEWSNQQLNRALAELMGWTDFKEDGHGGMWATAPDFLWTNKMPDYCTDPAASLEVQAKAKEVDAKMYVWNLSIVKWKDAVEPEEIDGWESINLEDIGDLLTASPRERAEAAYMTLQGAKGNE
ncbi:hypothetical protein [Paenibacillus sp. FSL L8-0708]|uniref:hypothetical protein n=1 Tax=Paenibacillus sp. FSL L8-0708 TaxID=2975311 RepID=UPI0030FC2C9B